jgi:hypothetical protein
LVISLVGPQKSRAAIASFSQFCCGTRPITSSLVLCRQAIAIRNGYQVKCPTRVWGHLAVLGIGDRTFDLWLRAPVDKYLGGPAEMHKSQEIGL